MPPPHYCRFFVYILCLPLLAAISLLGCIVWLLLLPLRFCVCCCPVACVAQLLADVVEYLLKAPVRGLMWATGQSQQPEAAAAAPKATDIETGGVQTSNRGHK